MRKIKLITLLPTTAMIAVLLLINGCSDAPESEAEKTESYESRTAEIGHEAAKSIKAPMENARDAVDKENKRMQEYEKSLGD